MTVTVIVTSFRRPEALADCLAGIRAQRHRPDEVLVVVHEADLDTRAALRPAVAEWPELRMVTVARHGSVPALNAGLSAARQEIVAFIDDDAVPAPDWLERIVATFARGERIAGVGGRDVVHADGRIVGREDQGIFGRVRPAPSVGRIQWFGRHVGNHHIGEGEARDADVLKGVNMAFRRQCVLGAGFDERLQGAGAKPHAELSVCLPLRKRGLRLIYDPTIVVNHYPAPRPHGDTRALDPAGIGIWTYNETLQILAYLPPSALPFYALWWSVLGSARAPGLATFVRHALKRRPHSWDGLVAAQRARMAAVRTHRSTSRQALAATPELTVAVVVATYRRTRTLGPCLAALQQQTRPPDEVIVTVHESDDESAPFVDAIDWSPLRRVTVAPTGLVAALNHGLDAARSDIVAFVDDDAIPAEDWLGRIVATYGGDETIAAVGGRDIVSFNGRTVTRRDEGIVVRNFGPPHVGRIQWFGRQHGNHHIGVGDPRDVDVLKGVNMSYRRRAVAAHGFDDRLHGRGVEVHSELSICLPLRRRGLRVVYDPAIVVNHFPQVRGFGDEREDVSHDAVHDAAHNEALQLLDYFSPGQRVVFGLYSFAVGSSEAPGLAILARHLLTGNRHAWTRFTATQRGRRVAWVTRETDRSPRSTQNDNSPRLAVH